MIKPFKELSREAKKGTYDGLVALILRYPHTSYSLADVICEAFLLEITLGGLHK